MAGNSTCNHSVTLSNPATYPSHIILPNARPHALLFARTFPSSITSRALQYPLRLWQRPCILIHLQCIAMVFRCTISWVFPFPFAQFCRRESIQVRSVQSLMHARGKAEKCPLAQQVAVCRSVLQPYILPTLEVS